MLSLLSHTGLDVHIEAVTVCPVPVNRYHTPPESGLPALPQNGASGSIPAPMVVPLVVDGTAIAIALLHKSLGGVTVRKIVPLPVRDCASVMVNGKECPP